MSFCKVWWHKTPVMYWCFITFSEEMCFKSRRKCSKSTAGSRKSSSSEFQALFGNKNNLQKDAIASSWQSLTDHRCWQPGTSGMLVAQCDYIRYCYCTSLLFESTAVSLQWQRSTTSYAVYCCSCNPRVYSFHKTGEYIRCLFVDFCWLVTDDLCFSLISFINWLATWLTCGYW